MRIYSHNEDDKYFFSPYLNVAYRDGRLNLHQRLFNTNISMICAPEAANGLCSALSVGADEKTLLNLLTRITGSEDTSSEFMTAMLQAGVLE